MQLARWRTRLSLGLGVITPATAVDGHPKLKDSPYAHAMVPVSEADR